MLEFLLRFFNDFGQFLYTVLKYTLCPMYWPALIIFLKSYIFVPLHELLWDLLTNLYLNDIKPDIENIPMSPDYFFNVITDYLNALFYLIYSFFNFFPILITLFFILLIKIVIFALLKKFNLFNKTVFFCIFFRNYFISIFCI